MLPLIPVLLGFGLLLVTLLIPPSDQTLEPNASILADSLVRHHEAALATADRAGFPQGTVVSQLAPPLNAIANWQSEIVPMGANLWLLSWPGDSTTSQMAERDMASVTEVLLSWDYRNGVVASFQPAPPGGTVGPLFVPTTLRPIPQGAPVIATLVRSSP